MNILDTPLGRYAPGIVNAVIEIPKGSKKKYRFHRKKRAFVVDYRLMVPAPTDYGWIPETLSPAGKRLDAMVLVRKPTWAGNVSEIRPIGALKRRDNDHKIVSVVLSEPRFETIRDLPDIDLLTVRRLVQFFEPFFPLAGWMPRDEALELIKQSHEEYSEKLRLHQIPESFDSSDEEDFPSEFEGDDDDSDDDSGEIVVPRRRGGRA
jgi:inorganic pyrophosphatase